MAKILFLAHRAPFPPNKGDKIRAYHILEHLSRNHEIWLGATVDDSTDLEYLAEARRRFAGAHFGALAPGATAVHLAGAALRGTPASVARFRHEGLARWVDDTLRRARPDIVYVYSSAPAQFVAGRLDLNARLIIDFVDADAEKWRQYAAESRAPMRWVYGAEFRRLVRFDARALAHAQAGILVSETEHRLFAQFAPQQARKLQVVSNGVDAAYFVPPAQVAPSADIVFTGMMDYRPNVDAAVWFAREIFPHVRESRPHARFRIVGARPAQQAQALSALPGVEVVGAVDDIRPYLFGAAAVVAPLRIARGVQNKVLEGMAAGRPVIATSAALDGIDAEPGRDLLVADDARAFAAAVNDVLCGRAPPDLGASARAFVLANHQWSRVLAPLDALIARLLSAPSAETST
ncbi:MAG TPA: TIGR03087 family PEP-CTERM/XrtA system glycosyltransferase [Rhizomicrobium sp.]|nr:TIGR03087 family PEP-CTERM/XrtA system glycosyltransferase [Rhizomicrobium sp.]